MKNTILPLALTICSCVCLAGTDLPRSTPEAQGVNSAGVLDFLSAADAQVDSMHGFMLLRHGHVVAEGWWAPYSAQSPHSLFSLSKSFTSTAVGLVAAEGKLSVDDEVYEFFPEDAPPQPSANLKAMRVRDLLTMSTGHHAEEIATFSFSSDEKLTKTFLSWPVAHKPGTLFVYNTPATFMQSAIVQKVTGQNLVDYLRPRLFEPLGIENPKWAQTKQGIAQGGTGLSIRTEDIAKFGQLYLQKGRWNGKQLIPESWVGAATSKQTSNGTEPLSDWDQGYGYQFWRARHGFYRGDGAFGQYCIVMPSLDAVVAINSGTRDMALVMNLIWDKLLPAMQSSGPLPTDDASHAKLKSKLTSLTIPLPSGSATSPMAKSLSGRTFALPKNEQKIDSVSLQVGDSEDTLTLQIGETQHRVICGKGAWKAGRSLLASDLGVRQVEPGEQPFAAAGAWTKPDMYVAKVVFYESPITLKIQLRFGGEFVLLDVEQNVAFAATTRPSIVGEMK